MYKAKVLVFTTLLLVVLLASLAVPVVAWFDRGEDGYLQGAPSNGRLGYTTTSTEVRAWTLDMRWSTTYYVRRDNDPRIDITADCDSRTGADHLHVIGFFSNLPSTSYRRWTDCGGISTMEEGEIFFDKYGISTTRTDYEANVIFQKKNPRTGNGAIDHSYQRSSGLDPKVPGRIAGDPNHDWLAKSIFDTSYNFIGFDPPNAGWTIQLGAARAYAAGLLVPEGLSIFTFAPPDAPFTVQVAKDGEQARAYVRADLSSRAKVQDYVQWNTIQAQILSASLEHPIPVKLTFRSPVTIAEAQRLIDATGLRLEQTIFVGRNAEGQPYSGSTFSEGPDSIIRLGVLDPLWQEKGIRLDGVMMIEGVLGQGDGLLPLLQAPQVYLVDVVADITLRELETVGVADLQGIVVPSPYWQLYMDWLSRQSS